MNPTRISTRLVLLVLAIGLSVALGSCAKSTAPDDEIAQNVGDQMAAIDEGGGATGVYAANEAYGARRTFARLLPGDTDGSWFERTFLPSAEATSCLLDAVNEFSSCSNNVITRNFNSCTVLTAVFSGTVTFTWTNGGLNNCTMPSAGQKVARAPNFTITGRRGGTFTASTTGTNGQVITRVATAGTSFTFSNDGIRRVLKDSSGTTLLDFTTQTTSAMTISGTSRTSRTLTGGTLRVTNNTSATTCDFSPTNVTWGATCNCATSGSWSGSCSDGKTATLTITGCGAGTLDVGGGTTDVTFDRCYGA